MLFKIAKRVGERIASRSRKDWEREIAARMIQINGHRSLRQALATSPPGFILEIKRTSPTSTGVPLEIDVPSTVRTFCDCGAAAISVLTEEDYFQGSLVDLQAARSVVSAPILRKDFVIDSLQIAEAKAYGADAVLLIVALLADEQLKEYLRICDTTGLEAIVEVHTEKELQRAVDADAEIVGVNNRNLLTMKIDLEAGARILRMVPSHCLKISESGIRTPRDVLRMRDAGADAFLIGTAIMRAANMKAKIQELMTA
jgi:indole-3-glycerol phosphate synthase